MADIPLNDHVEMLDLLNSSDSGFHAEERGISMTGRFTGQSRRIKTHHCSWCKQSATPLAFISKALKETALESEKRKQRTKESADNVI